VKAEEVPLKLQRRETSLKEDIRNVKNNLRSSKPLDVPGPPKDNEITPLKPESNDKVLKEAVETIKNNLRSSKALEMQDPMKSDEVPSNQESDNGASEVRKKPRLILHVGPQKTGSTSIQSMLDNIGIIKPFSGTLPGDNWDYEHVTTEQNYFNCNVGPMGGFQDCVPSEKLLARIESSRKDGKNLLLTDENLDGNYVKGLRDAIKDEDWDVTVIVMYRRIHSWLVSWYNQVEKTTNLDADGNILFDEDGHPYRTEHTKWPDQGGVNIPTFTDWYYEYTKYWKDTPEQRLFQHRSIGWYYLYKEVFDNVVLYNIHDRPKGTMIDDFFCNVLEANTSCEKIRNNEIPALDNNESVNLDLDILSVYAYGKGLIPKSAKRKEVVEAILRHIKETGKVLPRNCDLKMKDEIRYLLVETEKNHGGSRIG
jgi:hypothetical protein